MTNRFLISVAAAALIAGTGFANAQGTGTSRDSGSAGSSMQQSPSSGGGAMHKDSGGTAGMKGAESTKGSDSSGMKASESEKAGGASKSAQDSQRPRTEVEEHELGERRGQGRQGHEGRGP